MHKGLNTKTGGRSSSVGTSYFLGLYQSVSNSSQSGKQTPHLVATVP
jgi:hypothetical protein